MNLNLLFPFLSVRQRTYRHVYLKKKKKCYTYSTLLKVLCERLCLLPLQPYIAQELMCTQLHLTIH